MKTAFVLVGCLAVLTIGDRRPSAAPSQRTVFDDLLDRASGYVVRYERDCSAVVAEERYVQDLEGAPGRPAPTRSVNGPLHRELVSDVLLVQLPDETYFGFRDVATADGRPVRDRADRLESLFLKSLASLRKIQAESARYNIGRIQRTMNVPTYALALLHPSLRGRFVMKPAGEETIDGTAATVISFAERARPTIITDPRGHDIPSSGRFWIDTADGSVRRSRIVTGDDSSDVRADVTVDYRAHPEWKLLLPAEMREVYDEPASPGAPRILCVATYSGFRRFNVSVGESLKLPK